MTKLKLPTLAAPLATLQRWAAELRKYDFALTSDYDDFATFWETSTFRPYADGWFFVKDQLTPISTTQIRVDPTPDGSRNNYTRGDKLKFTQDAVTKMFLVTAAVNGTLTVTSAGLSSLSLNAITAPFISHEETPAAFPPSLGQAPVHSKNAIIGGDFSTNPWQRGTSFTVGAASIYTADRWYAFRSALTTGMSVSKTGLSVGDLPGTLNCLRMQRIAADASTATLFVQQSMESVNSRQFSGKPLTISFYARCGANYSGLGNFRVRVFSGTGTDQNLISGFTGSVTVIDQFFTPTTSFQRFEVSGLCGNINQLGVEISYVPFGTAGANDWVDIGLVQLEPYFYATDFEYQTYQEELLKCRRYYVSLGTLNVCGFIKMNSDACGGAVSFPVQMRITPTITIRNGSTVGGTQGFLAADVASGVTASFSSNEGFAQINKSAAWAAEIRAGFNYIADAEI